MKEKLNYTSIWHTVILPTAIPLNEFLDGMFGKNVQVKDVFPDVNTFVESVLKLQKFHSYEELSETNQFRLRKF